MLTKKISTLSAGILMLSLSACTNTTDIPERDASLNICFRNNDVASRSASINNDFFTLLSDDGNDSLPCFVEYGETILSRSTPVNDASQLTDIGCYAFINSEKALYINGINFHNNGDIFESANNYYWPGNHTTLDFYNYSPYNATGLTFNGDYNSPTFFYTVPVNANEQPDLLLARTTGVPGDKNTSLPVTMKHVLAAVTVKSTVRLEHSTVTRIAFKNVAANGVLTWENNEPIWSLGNTKNDVSASSTYSTTEGVDGAEVLETSQTFMLLPQTLDGVVMEVTVRDNGSGNSRTLSMPLAQSQIKNWEMGRTTVYHLGISAPGTLEFTTTNPPVQDAHYIIYRTSIKAADLDGHSWHLEASADDGANVSVQLASEANEYARDYGFWTDVEASDNVPGTKSARGTASFVSSATGELPILLFLPENISDHDRTITLRLYADRHPNTAKELQITQTHPAWNGTLGWEQIQEDIPQQFGFNWTRTTSYQFVYSVLNLSSEGYIAGGKYNGKQIRAIIANLQNLYNAESYTSVDHAFYQGNRRIYLYFDYTRLNNISAASVNDGLANTLNLSAGRSAFTGVLEYALQNTKKTEDGKEGEPLFRENAHNDGDNKHMPITSGNSLSELQDCALSTLLKKNRYYLNTTSSNGATTVAPYIAEENIKWFMPAKDQFSQKPSAVIDPIATDAWSSTAASASAQYLGDGTTASRSADHNIRACRLRE